MKRRNKKEKKHFFVRGSVLVYVFFIMAIMLVSVIGIISSEVKQKNSSFSTRGSVNSFQDADRGAEFVLYHAKNANSISDFLVSGETSCNSDGLIEADDGSFKVEFIRENGNRVSCDDASADLGDIDRLKSTGTDGDTARAVEMDMAF